MSPGLQTMLAVAGLIATFILGSYITYGVLKPRMVQHYDQTPRHREKAHGAVLFDFRVKPREDLRMTVREDREGWGRVFPEAPQSDEDERLWVKGKVLARSEAEAVSLIKAKVRAYLQDDLNLPGNHYLIDGLPDLTGFEIVAEPILKPTMLMTHGFDRGHFEYRDSKEVGWMLRNDGKGGRA